MLKQKKSQWSLAGSPQSSLLGILNDMENFFFKTPVDWLELKAGVLTHENVKLIYSRAQSYDPHPYFGGETGGEDVMLTFPNKGLLILSIVDIAWTSSELHLIGKGGETLDGYFDIWKIAIDQYVDKYRHKP